MKTLARLGSAVTIAAAAAGVFAAPASAATGQSATAGGASHVVFVQTDNPAGNQVVAYDRSSDGRLTLSGTFATGGLGGILDGSVVDHLASQGSLAYDELHGLLYAVNAGSNSLSVFAASGDRLRLRQVLRSGGTFPVSVTVHRNLVYVLNARDGGSVHGYRVGSGGLSPIPASTRALGLDPAATPEFTNTPGQVAFSPGGGQLIITTKANGSAIDVFGVRADGTLSASPAVNPEPGTVPFAIAFDEVGDLVTANAGTNALATFALHPDGTVTQLSSVGNGQAATCWVTPDRGLLLTGNAGSATVSSYLSRGGRLTLAGSTVTDPGTVDSAASPDGRFLYVQTGANGIVDEFAVSNSGTLTKIGSVTVPGAVGGEGISAA